MSDVNQIELKNINKHYGDFHVLKDINVYIPKGQFVALVGPSGCGKSTLLRSIAGLESISSGTISIADNVMNNLPPRKRDVAMVFQSYALYPHMTVLDNLTYSLRVKGTSKLEANTAALDVARVVGLSELLKRYPRELSGGQRQRVAMGRAIIRNPKAFLFDEPLSNLDASLRVHMRKEIRALHNRLGATSVYVTHDQIEAMTMADHIVVLNGGEVSQQGSPMELYEKPANKFVAGFIGSPAMNFVPGVVNPDGKSITLEYDKPQIISLERTLTPGQKLDVGMRPEHLEICNQNADIDVCIAMKEITGPTSYYISNTTPELTTVQSGTSPIVAGDVIGLKIKQEHIFLFDQITGLTL
ncbi:ABC transporter ATP-binding protein [Marinomonas polaris]|jgi:multiple sugar transport system ATP-binding protein|uniref:ABC transporter ATP-binding protein n=1 Tax=Marinomonas polaris TaxID=293552 RepID=UPI003F9DFE88|tara:strand:- start:4227 stop:5297 length:1071 start_codon:yes stop_codon:yes gene_type:complete